MSTLVRKVHRWTMRVTANVDAVVEADVTFTDADVRDFFDLADDVEIDREMIDEYAEEIVNDGDVELKDIRLWNSSDTEMVAFDVAMEAPAGFVPLPGMEVL